MDCKDSATRVGAGVLKMQTHCKLRAHVRSRLGDNVSTEARLDKQLWTTWPACSSSFSRGLASQDLNQHGKPTAAKTNVLWRLKAMSSCCPPSAARKVNAQTVITKSRVTAAPIMPMITEPTPSAKFFMLPSSAPKYNEFEATSIVMQKPMKQSSTFRSGTFHGQAFDWMIRMTKNTSITDMTWTGG